MRTMPPTRSFNRRSKIMLLVFALFLGPILARAAVYAIGDGPRSDIAAGLPEVLSQWRAMENHGGPPLPPW